MYKPPSAICSPICGSAYEVVPSSHLIDFACANGNANAIVEGLGARNRLVLQMVFNESGLCSSGWNASPIPSVPFQY